MPDRTNGNYRHEGGRPWDEEEETCLASLTCASARRNAFVQVSVGLATASEASLMKDGMPIWGGRRRGHEKSPVASATICRRGTAGSWTRFTKDSYIRALSASNQYCMERAKGGLRVYC